MFQFKPSVVATSIFIATLGLTGCGGGSSSTSTVTPPVTTNAGPTDFALSNNNVAENNVSATVGTLTAVGADANDVLTYSVNDARFVVADAVLKLAADTAMDYETEATVAITITLTDGNGTDVAKEFTINVDDVLEAPATYAFESQFSADSSVSYSGQTARQVLIADLFSYIGSQLKADVDNSVLNSKADVLAKLHSFYAISSEDYDLTVGDRALMLSTSLGNVQTTLKQISSSHKDLTGKIAGNDEVGQHKDWSTEMVGWNAKGSVSPEGLAYELMEKIADNVQTYLDGSVRFDPMGNAINHLYLDQNGVDLNQMLQKFLLGALAFSQAADDYLDDTVDGKGLLSDNTVGDKDGTKPYTALEHSYDEGFGYFGAARNYNEYTDDEIAKKGGRDDWQGYHDVDTNGAIDLLSEFNFGNSTNAAKRDRGTVSNTNPTDLSKVIFDAFLMGRAIIVDAGGALNDEQMAALQAQRDIIVMNWEKAISSTVVHYINDTIGDMDKIGTDEYDFATHAKHWSEMKGFALNLQFNPRTPVTAEQFAQLHDLIGMAPVTGSDDLEGYKTKLLEARDILQAAYEFDADNVANW